MTTDLSPERQLADWRALALAIEAAVNTAMVGQDDAVRLLCIAVFTRGHVILEGSVGVGKTTLLRAVASTKANVANRIARCLRRLIAIRLLSSGPVPAAGPE